MNQKIILSPPKLEIDDKEGFTSKDKFGLKDFGESLNKIIVQSGQELVIAIDGKWGSGKTTFIKFFQGHLRNSDPYVHTIYFDAFASDHTTDAFISLVGVIMDYVKNNQKKTTGDTIQKFIDSTVKVSHFVAPKMARQG